MNPPMVLGNQFFRVDIIGLRSREIEDAAQLRGIQIDIVILRCGMRIQRETANHHVDDETVRINIRNGRVIIVDHAIQ